LGGLVQEEENEEMKASKLCERYDPKKKRWEKMISLKTARVGLCAVGVEKAGEIYVLGGGPTLYGKTKFKTVEIYSKNGKKESWTVGPPMKKPRKLFCK